MSRIIPIIIDRKRTNDSNLGFDEFFNEMVRQYRSSEGLTHESLSSCPANTSHQLENEIMIKHPESYYANDDSATKIVEDLLTKTAELNPDRNTLFRLIWSARLSFQKDAYPSDLIKGVLDIFKDRSWTDDYKNIKFFIITEDPGVYDYLDRYPQNLIQDGDVYDRSFFVDTQLKSSPVLQDDVYRFIKKFFDDNNHI